PGRLVGLQLAISPSRGLGDLGNFPLWFQRLDHTVASAHTKNFGRRSLMGLRRSSSSADSGQGASIRDRIPITMKHNAAIANKRFAAWQQSMSAAGFTAAAGHVGMAGNALALTRFDISGSGWHWTAVAARIDVAGKDNFDITTNGDQTLSFTFNGNAVQYRA